MNKEWIIIGIIAALALAMTADSALTEAGAKSEDEIGLRRETTLYDETKAMPAHGEYGKAHLERPRERHGDVPVVEIPLFPQEVRGVERLRTVGRLLVPGSPARP